MLTSYLFAALFYLSAACFVLGLCYRLFQYWRTPQPYPIVITPAPKTLLGRVINIGAEILLFKSIFKADKWAWLFGYSFHLGLFIALIRHSFYFVTTIPDWLIYFQSLGDLALGLLVFGLCGLLLRRLVIDRIRYISTPSDYAHLIYLLIITLLGGYLHHINYPNIGLLKYFIDGLYQGDIRAFPESTALKIHIALALYLLMIFPLSKLLHAIGLLVNPAIIAIDKGHKHTTDSNAR